jgi:hypothetical protein
MTLFTLLVDVFSLSTEALLKIRIHTPSLGFLSYQHLATRLGLYLLMQHLHG